MPPESAKSAAERILAAGRVPGFPARIDYIYDLEREGPRLLRRLLRLERVAEKARRAVDGARNTWASGEPVAIDGETECELVPRDDVEQLRAALSALSDEPGDGEGGSDA